MNLRNDDREGFYRHISYTEFNFEVKQDYLSCFI